MTKINIYLLLLLCILSISCASTEQYLKYSNNDNHDTHATIYVIRYRNYGSAVPTKVYQNGGLVGKLGPKSYLTWNVPADQPIMISVRNQSKDHITINPKAGKTYFLRQRFMGLASKATLEYVDNDEGARMLSGLKRPKVRYIE